jgi:predicted dehydrogenase
MGVPALRWGILGAARINRHLIPQFRAAAGPQTIEAIASRDGAKAYAAAADWQIPAALSSYDALLERRDIDAVYVPLPNHLHAEWTVKAARAGKHVLCEKPLALSVDEVDRVRGAAADNRVHVAEAFMYRHHAQTDAVVSIVRSGSLGPLRMIRGCFSFFLDREGDVRFDPGMGGGSAWDVGCYPVSYARLVAGTEPVAARADAVIGPTGIDVTLAGVLRFPGGLLAAVDCSFVAPFRTEMEIVGERGTLRVPRPFKPGPRETITVVRGDEVEEHIVEGRVLYVDQIENFARAAAGGAAPKVTLEDSRGNVAALRALLDAARN